jgi:excisionase family DNA binding protein
MDLPITTSAVSTVLTARELSRIVPLHAVTILRWAREGRIPSHRLSPRKVVFIPSEINEWLASGSNLYPVSAGRAA